MYEDRDKKGNSMLEPITVMLTASGSQFAPGIVKCFKKNGEREVRVVGGDIDADPSNKYVVDRFYQLPPVNNPHYAERVAEICEMEKVQILFPQMSAELPVYYEKMKLFTVIGTKVSMTDNRNIYIANNKLKLYEFMQDSGISVVPFKRATDLDAFDNAVTELGYPEKPVCVKLTESSGSRGIRIIDSSKSLYDLFVHSKPESFHTTLEYMRRTLKEASEFPELLVMKSLPGNEYTVDLLADHGKVLYISGRNNLRMMMSIAQESVLEENHRAFSIARQMVEGLKLDGVIGMDFIFDENGLTQLMDMNPRIDATVSIFAAGGLNLPYLCIKKMLGEKLPDMKVNYGTHLRRRYDEIFTNAVGQTIEW